MIFPGTEILTVLYGWQPVGNLRPRMLLVGAGEEHSVFLSLESKTVKASRYQVVEILTAHGKATCDKDQLIKIHSGACGIFKPKWVTPLQLKVLEPDTAPGSLEHRTVHNSHFVTMNWYPYSGKLFKILLSSGDGYVTRIGPFR